MLLNISDLKAKRIKLNITQAELAKVTGLHPSAIARTESEKHDCQVSTLKLLNEGISIISQNRHSKFNGAIILSPTDFENTLYRAMLRKLETLELEGKYKGNGHHLTQKLVSLISKKFNKEE